MDGLIRASDLFPLARLKRTAPAYFGIIFDPDSIDTLHGIEEGLRTDPNAADLRLHKVRWYLHHNMPSEYDVAMRSLKQLLPRSEIRAVPVGGQP